MGRSAAISVGRAWSEYCLLSQISIARSPLLKFAPGLQRLVPPGAGIPRSLQILAASFSTSSV